MAQPYLSKSSYLVGLQCRKLLWTRCNAPDQLPPIDNQTRAAFDQGHVVGLLAQKLFLNGLAVPDELSLDETIEQSRRLLAERKPLFEATFIYERALARADILNPTNGGEWDLIEVKSSTEVKDLHLEDVAFQRRCCEGAGVPIRRCCLMHVNNEYVRRGEIDPSILFATEDITDGVNEKARGIEERVREMLRVIGRRKSPDMDIGPHCSDVSECPFASVCWKKVRSVERNVFSLTRLGAKTWALYEDGIVRNDRIPADFPLSKTQKAQLQAERTNKPHVDQTALTDFLGSLKYPLYFLDFETLQDAIPLIDGTRPYQQIPFQFSLHVAETRDSEPVHSSWLWDAIGDPRQVLLDRLLPPLGTKGSIVVYNASFETTRLRECAEAYPRSSAAVESVVARIVDLYAPFRSFSVYHPAQHGSASLKAVLPAFTGKSYEALAIQDGGQASEKFKTVMLGEASAEEREKVRINLEAYCGMDTIAMLEIIGALRSLVKPM